jgi:Tol biopolymer transport system component
MLFHVRAAHGGTVMVHGSEAHKIAIKHDSILGAGVYPSWHPTLPLVAFSTNKTGQVFHMLHKEKIEVLDEASDLLLYDAEKNAVHNVIRTTDHLETFPCWSPDGRRLYYCSAPLPESLRENYVSELMAMKYDSLIYDIYSMPFDPDTRTFGTPRLEVDCASMGKSASVPRVSPDGQYLHFTLGDYGQFHIWHKSADLWVKEIRPTPAPSRRGGEKLRAAIERSEVLPLTGERREGLYPLVAANAADEPDSYHSWSSNGRWIVFASRRDDGNFSRAYIAYFDRNGQAHKAFLLPQRDPEHNLLLLKSYNVPELTRSAVKVSRATLDHVVLHTEAEVATYE